MFQGVLGDSGAYQGPSRGFQRVLGGFKGIPWDFRSFRGISTGISIRFEKYFNGFKGGSGAFLGCSRGFQGCSMRFQ